MPERVATMDAEFSRFGELRELLSRALGRNPLDTVGLFVLLIGSGAILVNALYRQPGPHPAPIFSVKPRPVVTEPADGVVPPLPRARPPAPAAVKQEAPAAAKPDVVPAKAEPVQRTANRADPIGNLITTGTAPQSAPSPRIMKAQSALNDFGYGPVKATGTVDAATTAAVQKFEKARKLPVTGQLSAKVIRELSADTGRPLD